jgi:putative nucleotidyltransferase with HDIG domain
MSTHLRTISINDLRPGMFICDVFNDKNVLLFSSNNFITGFHQIESLKKQGVSVVTVISQSQRTETESADSFKKYEEFRKQVKQAETIRKNTIDAIRSMVLAAKVGRYFSIKDMISQLQDLVTQMLEQPDVTIGVTQIKNYSEQLYAHSVNVSVLMIGFASVLGYSKEHLLEAGIAGILHDIGMVRLPEELVHKEGFHTRQELESIKKHPFFGLEILQKFGNELPSSVFHVVAQHHERLNGGGYPQCLKGDQIQQMSMLCAIADVYDRLTTPGSAKSGCLPQEALALIFQGADEQYPRELVEYFTRLMGIYPVGSFVKLESGEMGLVIKVNRDNLLSPQLIMLFDQGGRRIEKLQIRDLSRNEESKREFWKVSCSLDPANFGINPAEFFNNDKTL